MPVHRYALLSPASFKSMLCCLVQLDLAVVEVGLGGARDATNVIDADTLRVAVITSIGTDHKAALGEASQKGWWSVCTECHCPAMW